tara:strand:- start:546 stop:1166 length:621 start_codon:yes stop_codon:yes gene_type:complete
MSEYKNRFGRGYQDRVGQFPKHEFLTTNSIELAKFLNDNKIISDGMNIFEIGAGGCRNLKFIHDLNSNVNLFANDLYEDASRKNMHESIKEKVNFTEMDTLSMFEQDENLILDDNKIDLLLSSDHLMHVDKKSVISILEYICTKWKPTYIVLRELINESGEEINRTWPRVYHDYEKGLSNHYDLISEGECSNRPDWYKLLLYKVKS